MVVERRRARSTRSHFAASALACLALAGAFTTGSEAKEPLTDSPIVWHEDDRRDIPKPETRDVALRKDQVHTTLVRPVSRAIRPSRLLSKLGGGETDGPARNVNALGEVPNSSWFTNRIGLFAMSPDAIEQGSGLGTGPSLAGPWTIVKAKTEGVTPGFEIKDSEGVRFLIKFDPMEFPGIATRAGVVCGRLFHAAGYNVPDDAIVHFKRDRLRIADGVQLRQDGKLVEMTEAHLDEILTRGPRGEDGRYLAISSRFLSGEPAGFFDFKGRRDDDPNDRVKHEDRRELRGLRLFAAWVRHFDTKQGNTLDMYVEEDGKRFLRHYLIDFASTLGTGASGPSPKFGMEYGTDVVQMFGRLFTLGFHEDEWRKEERPEDLDEIGFFGADRFDPLGFKPLTPNTAFAHMSKEDGYWAAKVISSFRREHLEAAVRAGRYEDPAAAAYLVAALEDRRDVIARKWFSEVVPIDFFRIEQGVLSGTDLAVERGFVAASGTKYRIRKAFVSADRTVRGEWSDWDESNEPSLHFPRPRLHPDLADAFFAAEFQVDRGDGFGSKSVTVYVAPHSGRIVGVDR